MGSMHVAASRLPERCAIAQMAFGGAFGLHPSRRAAQDRDVESQDDSEVDRGGAPYRDSGEPDILYRRASELARWSPVFAGVGVVVLGVALWITIATLPSPSEGRWMLLVLWATGLSAVLTPIVARRRLARNPQLIDPSGNIVHAEKLARAGLTLAAGGMTLALFVLLAPLVLIALFALGLLTGVIHWPG